MYLTSMPMATLIQHFAGTFEETSVPFNEGFWKIISHEASRFAQALRRLVENEEMQKQLLLNAVFPGWSWQSES